MKLPGGMLRLLDRVPALDPAGGRFGLGFVRAEYDVRPDDWFLTCHFVDDQVMPGTLMYECCLHTLRVLLMRMGWVGEEGEVATEPVPGVSSRLKCRGQVLAATKVVCVRGEREGVGVRAGAVLRGRCADVRRRQADRRDHEHDPADGGPYLAAAGGDLGRRIEE